MIRLALLLVYVSLGSLCVQALDGDDTDDHWNVFKEKFNKTYDSSEEEEKGRENFEKNLLHVALHNVKDEDDYDKGVHEYSDMSVKEQIEALCGTDVPTEVRNYVYTDFSTSTRALPSSVNWVTAGKVSSVRNQGSCGSCWSFSAAQALEGQVAIKKNRLLTLSEQQQVDCASSYGNNGCNGGWPQSAFNYIKNEGGLVQDKDYPYKAQEGTCKVPSGAERFKISGYTNVGPSGDEGAVAKALAENGPLTSAIYVSDNFMHYSGGVFKDSSYSNQGVNHGVLLVGYGTDNGVQYWLVKNSWGPSWGEKGYIRIVRNQNNHLKIASYTSYPTVV